MPTELADRTRALTLELVSWPSVTGTADEAAFAPRLAALLAEHSYFRQHPAHLAVRPIAGDRLGRANVLALVKGSGQRTVLLTGHFDVVPVDEYGDLAPLAGKPEELARRLIERLRASGTYPMALRDLESGAFMPGRGALDMKSGVAAGIAVLEQFAAGGGAGNLLLVATPDEENQSAGMRAAVPEIAAFAAMHDLHLELAINLDATCDTGDGRKGQVVAMGSIGKLLLSAFVVGTDAHASQPLDGVNGAYLAAELVSALEFAPELGELTQGELATPPATLGLRDLKAGYTVTTPSRVWVFWNVMSHRRPATEVFAIARGLAAKAMVTAHERLARRAKSTGAAVSMTAAWQAIPIMTFADLQATAAARDQSYLVGFHARALELAGRDDLDFPSRSRALIEFAWDASGLSGPAVVLAIGSLPYPALTLEADQADLRTLLLSTAAQVGLDTDTRIGAISWFPGISDMSFLKPGPATDLAFIASNTPLWGSTIIWPEPEAALAHLPVINIGPWGRDYHHWLERVHVGYAFGVLPRLLAATCHAVLMRP